MKACYLFVLIALSVHSMADISNDLATCSSMSGDLDRLECFDGVASKNGLGGPKVVKSGGKGRWATESSVDPIDDSATANAVLLASDGFAPRGAHPAFYVRCASDTTQVFVNFSEYLGSRSTAVTYRVGKQEAVASTWSLSTNNQAAFMPQSGVIPFLRQMVTAEKLIIQTTPYGENPRTYVFDTTGAREALADIASTCGWSF